MAKLKGKFLEQDSVAGDKILLANAEPLRGKNAAGNANINMWLVNALNRVQPGADIDLNSKKLLGLADPTGATEPSTKGYTDNLVSTSITGLASTAYVDSAVAPLATSAALTSGLSSKADAAATTTALGTKASTAYVDDAVAPLATSASVTTGLAAKADAAATTTALAAKASTTYVDDAVAPLATTSALTTGLATKADASATTTALATKASTSYVDSAVSPKANTSDVNTALGLKADAADLANYALAAATTTALATKASTSYVDSAVSPKANASDVTTALALKANQEDVDVALSTRATNARMDTALAAKASIVYVDDSVAPKANTSDVNTALALKADAADLTSGLAAKADVTALNQAILGLALKAPVRVATTAALPANTYSNGVITASANGLLPAIDGVANLAVSDRILVKNESASANNGIYVITSIGLAGAPFVLTRSSDATTGDQLKGAYVFSQEGTTQADHEFLLATDGVPTVGTTALTWSDFGTGMTYSAGQGISINSGVIAVRVGEGLEFDIAGLAQVKTQGPGTLNTTTMSTGVVKGLSAKKETFALSSTNITNQYLDLANVAHTDSVRMVVSGGGSGIQGVDFTVSYTGGTNSKSRVSLIGDLAALLDTSDTVELSYQYL